VKAALAWTRKGAEAGNPPGQHNLGLAYLRGEGVPQDTQKALDWFRKAAEQGHTLSQHQLASLLFFGKGVPKDTEAQAAKLLRRASEKGRPTAGEHLRLLCARTPGLGACQKAPA
jgi:TPR repeat protein